MLGVIGAPVLASTVDFLIAAGEPHRQGHHTLALLRLVDRMKFVPDLHPTPSARTNKSRRFPALWLTGLVTVIVPIPLPRRSCWSRLIHDNADYQIYGQLSDVCKPLFGHLCRSFALSPFPSSLLNIAEDNHSVFFPPGRGRRLGSEGKSLKK